jgi:ADP-ribose pyrophosphatase YjhB (NUDIX family)
MRFCSECGGPVSLSIPAGDTRPRAICQACGQIHYSNPRVVTGCVLEHQGRILLCRRSIEPRAGFWTLPAGFLEDGETMADGAQREAMEEALAPAVALTLFAIMDVPGVCQVHVMYRGELATPTWGVGEESSEVVLAEPSAIPWDQLAFPSVEYTLRRYMADRSAGVFGLHTTTVRRRMDGSAEEPDAVPVAE